MKIAIGIVLLMCQTIALAQDLSNALVEIYSTRAELLGSQVGVGTFISPGGDILTAYHVVQGAKTLDVYSSATGEKCTELRILRFDETRDLAVLNCKVVSTKPVNYAPIGEVPPLLISRSGMAIGYPDGKPLSQVAVRFLQNAPMKASDYAVDNKQLFAQSSWDVRLLNVEATLPPGMSGGPIIVGGRVVAIISGSEEVRAHALGWAMLASDSTASTMKTPEQNRRFDLLPPLSMLKDTHSKSKLPWLKITFSPTIAVKLSQLRLRGDSLRKKLEDVDLKSSLVVKTLEEGTLLPLENINHMTQLLGFADFDLMLFETIANGSSTLFSLFHDGLEIMSWADDNLKDSIDETFNKHPLPTQIPQLSREMLQKGADLYGQLSTAEKEKKAMLDTLILRNNHFQESLKKVSIYNDRILASIYALMKLTTIKNGVESCSNCNLELRGLRDDLHGSIEALRILSRETLLSAESMENVARLYVSLSVDLAEAAAANNKN